MREIRKTVCNRDCPDACSIVAHVEDGRVVQLGGDPAHPVTGGFLCWRTNNFLPLQYHPERLTTPLLRGKPVSWDEALDFAARELTRIRAQSGPAAIFHYRSGGSLGALKHLGDYFFEQFGPTTTKRGDICSGAGDEAQMIRRTIAIGQTTSDLSCCKIDFVSQVTKPVFIQLESTGSKRIGLQHITQSAAQPR